MNPFPKSAVMPRRSPALSRAGALAAMLGAMLAAMLVASSAVSAQRINLRGGGASSGNATLPGALRGGGIDVSWPLGESGLRVHLSGEHYSGTRQEFGVPCGGLIQPGTCAPEPLRNRGNLSVFAGGGNYPLLRATNLRVGIIGEVNVASVNSTKTGLTTGASIASSAPVWGGSVGGFASFIPAPRVPLSLDAGATVGAVRAIFADQATDSYEPFRSGSFRVSRVWLGVSIGRNLVR